MPKTKTNPEIPSFPVRRPSAPSKSGPGPVAPPTREFNRASRHRGQWNKKNKG